MIEEIKTARLHLEYLTREAAKRGTTEVSDFLKEHGVEEAIVNLAELLNKQERTQFEILADGDPLSNCCGAPRWMDLESDICSECKEHADFTMEDE